MYFLCYLTNAFFNIYYTHIYTHATILIHFFNSSNISHIYRHTHIHKHFNVLNITHTHIHTCTDILKDYIMAIKATLL